MSVSTDILAPLKMSRYVLDHRLSDGFPLQIVVKQYVDLNNTVSATDVGAVTILLGHGIGMSTEMWIPTVKALYRLNTKGSSIKIRSIWAVDLPNHGETGMLNEEVLKEKFSEQFTLHEYGKAITIFLSTGLLSPIEKSTLVAIGHSGGNAAFITTATANPTAFKRLIMIEPSWFDHSVKPLFEMAIAVVRKRKSQTWSSVEEAMQYLETRRPYKRFHPDVMRIIADTHFRTIIIDGQKRVATKTSTEQEKATWAASEDAFRASEWVAPLVSKIRVHVLFGGKQDMWPEPVHEVLLKGVEAFRPQLASITTVEGAGHHVPQEKPEELAAAIIHALNHDRVSPPAKL